MFVIECTCINPQDGPIHIVKFYLSNRFLIFRHFSMRLPLTA